MPPPKSGVRQPGYEQWLGGWEQRHRAEERGEDSAPVTRGADNEEKNEERGNDSMPEAGRLLNMMNNSDDFLLKQSPCRQRKYSLSCCFHGNIVTLERQTETDIPCNKSCLIPSLFIRFFLTADAMRKKYL